MNSRGYQIPKVSTIFKQGVSFFSKNYTYFFNSRTAGMSNTGSFILLGETPASQLAESDGGSFIHPPPTYIPDFWNS